jgi:thymidylate synthase (FAD)
MKTPKTFLVGYTVPDLDGITQYLEYTGQKEFLKDWQQGLVDHINPAECLVSLFAKLCYKSLVIGKNSNITKTRSIKDNLLNVIASGHGSVFEHPSINFITTDCSRVMSHELVRHRVGTAYSQTSGRYCAIDDDMDIVFPPEYLDDRVTELLNQHTQHTIMIAKLLQKELLPENADFAVKKKITSAIRRIAPNGQTNEIAWSMNFRTLRHVIEMRTSHHAEWEIRYVFNEVAELISKQWPMIFEGGDSKMIDGNFEYTELRI